MQAKKTPNRTFSDRTDELSAKLGVNVVDLTNILGIAKSTLFTCRKDDKSVSRKTWLKLEAGERKAGVDEEDDATTEAPKPDGVEERLERIEGLLEELLKKTNQETSSGDLGSKKYSC